MTGQILPGRLYDAVKYTVLIALPALSTAYMGLDAAVDGALPYEDQVVKVLAVLALLLGTLTGVSKFQYNNDDSRFDGVAYVDRLDPTNNPDILLKNPSSDKTPKTLNLKVAETAPPQTVTQVGDVYVEDETDDPLFEEGSDPNHQ